MFNNLSAYKRTGDETFTLELQTPIGQVNLTGKIAREANTAYYNEVLKLAGSVTRKAKQSGIVTASQVQEARQRDIELFPSFIFTNWSYIDNQGNEQVGPPDSDGNFVSYTPEAGLAFLEALDGEVVDYIRGEFANTANFTPRLIDGEQVGKN